MPSTLRMDAIVTTLKDKVRINSAAKEGRNEKSTEITARTKDAPAIKISEMAPNVVKPVRKSQEITPSNKHDKVMSLANRANRIKEAIKLPSIEEQAEEQATGMDGLKAMLHDPSLRILPLKKPE